MDDLRKDREWHRINRTLFEDWNPLGTPTPREEPEHQLTYDQETSEVLRLLRGKADQRELETYLTARTVYLAGPPLYRSDREAIKTLTKRLMERWTAS